MKSARPLWKKVLIGFAAIFLLALCALMALIASEFTYLKRLRHFSKQLPTPVEWFKPKEIVSGAAPVPLPTANAAQIPLAPQAISNAVTYAMSGHASAFLILHDGRLIEERYAPDHGPNKWTD